MCIRDRGYTVLTPANRYASRLPSLRAGLLYKLVTPRLAPARFGQYVVAFEAAGTLKSVAPGFEDFLYVLDGELDLRADGLDGPLRPGSWCYLPAAAGFSLRAGERSAELLWLKRRYEPWPGLAAPAALAGHRDDEPFEPDPAAVSYTHLTLPTTPYV